MPHMLPWVRLPMPHEGVVRGRSHRLSTESAPPGRRRPPSGCPIADAIRGSGDGPAGGCGPPGVATTVPLEGRPNRAAPPALGGYGEAIFQRPRPWVAATM